MAITYPRALPTCYGLQASPMVPMYQQTYALSAGGSPQAADVGPMVWTCDYVAEAVSRASVVEWEAWLHSLRGRLRQFRGIVPRHKWPISRPTGFTGLLYSASQWDGTGNLSVIGANRDTVTIDEMPDGLVLSAGDWFSFSDGTRNHLHRIIEGGTTAAGAVALTIEPVIRPGITTGKEVFFEAPWCPMVLMDEPSISKTANGHRATISFKGVQVLL